MPRMTYMDGHNVAKIFFAYMSEGWIREREKTSSEGNVKNC
jgi:hypothetical protein